MTALRKIAAKPRDITEKPGHAPLAFPRLIKVTRASQSLLKVYEVQETGDGVQTLRRLDLGADKTDPRQIESRLVAIARDYCTHHDAGVLALLAAGSACQFYLSGKCHKKTYGTRDAFAEACFGVSDRTVREWIKAYNLFEDIGGLKVASPTRIYQLTVLGKIKPHFRRRAWAETSTANYGKSASGAAIMRWAERNDALIEASPKNDPSHIPDLPLSNDFEAEIFIKDLGDQATQLKHHNFAEALEMLAAYMRVRSTAANQPTERRPAKRGSRKRLRGEAGQLQMFSNLAASSARPPHLKGPAPFLVQQNAATKNQQNK